MNDFLIAKVHIFHALEGELEIGHVIHIRDRLPLRLVRVVVIIELLQAILSQEFLHERGLLLAGHFGCSDYLVENVEVPFYSILEAYTGFLQQIVDNRS